MNLFIIKNDAEETLLALRGELDTAASVLFAEQLETMTSEIETAPKVKRITMDLKELEYISSTAMRALLVLNKTVSAKGGKITMLNMREEIRQIFHMVGFDNMFEIL